MHEVVVVGYDHINCLSIIRGLGEKNIKMYVIFIAEGFSGMCTKSKFISGNFCVVKLSNIVQRLAEIGEESKRKIPLFSCDDPETYLIDQNLDMLSQYYYCENIKMTQGAICRLMDKYEQY